ncbi:MAG TPA: sterol desaturase family protein [Vicinamibacterales bacterium]|nr:sterol desaturase family protein [Vicinamibacterales bacterium]
MANLRRIARTNLASFEATACAPKMLTDLLGILALLIPFALTGLLVEAFHVAQARQSGYTRNLALNVLCTILYFAGDMVAGTFFSFCLAKLIRALPGAGVFALPTPDRLTPLYVVGVTALWLAIGDFFNYWWHRLQHTSTWLWAQHEVHHSDEHLNVTSAYRHHWLESPFKTVAMVAPITYLFVPVPAIAATVSLTGLGLTFFAHMNARIGFGPLNWILLTPQMHRIHHSRESEHRDRNFAFIFPLWDVLFGTYYHPHSIEYPATGLASGEKLVTPWQAIAWPFLRWSGRTSKL